MEHKYILIADSGSSKTSWAISNTEGVKHCKTKGINPFFMNESEILYLLENEYSLEKENITEIHFYGAGCTIEKSHIVTRSLSKFFNTNNVSVKSDLLGVARSVCGNKEGIACILGTGSNSCYYDGEDIANNVSPLGYILGDEGSGAVLGKKLIADILKNQLPNHIRDAFFCKYKLSSANIIDKVYRQPLPNRFLASFAPFLYEYKSEETIKNIIENSFDGFVVRNLYQYPQSKELPVHFVGSIAYYFEDNLKRVLSKHSLSAGNIIKEPIDGLVSHHFH
ncbi:N-acetylglucosamine kinase-like BadF-type ATPase [Dysgonomonadaceae bacterium PH5-43]|nr:N-acetylglucosamine kinase-like BadF-type ATPase [Dysgonomonadaceae bacterium PH5-43]